MHSTRLLVLLFGLVTASALVRAADDPVSLAIVPPKTAVVAGATVVVRVTVTVTPPYHIYSTEQQVNASGLGPNATQIALKSTAPLTLAGAVKTSPAAKHYDPNFGMDLLTLGERAWLDVPIRVAPGTAAGRYAGTLLVTYQACDEQTCLPPTDTPVPFTLGVAAATTTPPQSPEPSRK